MSFTDELTAAMEALYLSGEVIMKTNRIPPQGRLFEKGNKARRRFGMEETAQVCALGSLGVSNTGIKKIMDQMYPGKPVAAGTVAGIRYGEAYADLRQGAVFAQRHEHYMRYFEDVFRAFPGWRPSGDAVRQARSSSTGSKYRGNR